MFGIYFKILNVFTFLIINVFILTWLNKCDRCRARRVYIMVGEVGSAYLEAL
jgi:hypothetical protein